MFFKMDDAESCCTKTGKKERAGPQSKARDYNSRIHIGYPVWQTV